MNNVIEINDLLFEWNNKNQFSLKIKELNVQNKKNGSFFECALLYYVQGVCLRHSRVLITEAKTRVQRAAPARLPAP